jgi:hypothetical protein
MELLTSHSARECGGGLGRPPRVRLLAAFVLAVVSLLCAGGAGAPRLALEYELKAVFIYKLVHFVDWPDDVLAPGKPLVIGVLGRDPFGGSLRSAFAAGGPSGRKVVLRHFAQADDLEPCHVLFVSRSERARTCALVDSLATQATLTIGDFHGFGAQGGVVTLTMDDKRVRVAINRDASRRAGLRISSKLLRLALPVSGRACSDAPSRGDG